MSKAKSLVALAKSDDIQANVTRVFDLMGGVTNVIRKGHNSRAEAECRSRRTAGNFSMHQSGSSESRHPRGEKGRAC